MAFAISSPTFLGLNPRGPIFGAKAELAPTSPPVALRWITLTSLGSNFGGIVELVVVVVAVLDVEKRSATKIPACGVR